MGPEREVLGISVVPGSLRMDELSRVLPSWFQCLEMMEEEEEGELPVFQQFEMKVLAVVKPPPEEEQPQDRVSPWHSSPPCCLLEELLPGPDLPTLHRGTRPPWGSCGVSHSPPPSRG